MGVGLLKRGGKGGFVSFRLAPGVESGIKGGALPCSGG